MFSCSRASSNTGCTRSSTASARSVSSPMRAHEHVMGALPGESPAIETTRQLACLHLHSLVNSFLIYFDGQCQLPTIIFGRLNG